MASNEQPFDIDDFLKNLPDVDLEAATRDLFSQDPYDPSFSSLNDFPNSPATLLELSLRNELPISPDNPPQFNHSNPPSIQSQVTDVSSFTESNRNEETLRIIAEPYYGKKLRYRSDYEENKNRKGFLGNRNSKSSFQGPAITIPKRYQNVEGHQYYIRVTLVTVRNRKTNLHYIHPYELEDPIHETYNDRTNNAVFYPVEGEDLTGVKCFSSLRIVKKTAPLLKSSEPLRVFDFHHDEYQRNHTLPQLSSAKQTIEEYDLDQTLLAFTVVDYHDEIWEILTGTTVFSQPMIESPGKESDGNQEVLSSADQGSPSTMTVSWKTVKYAPRSGFAQGNEEMIIVLSQKPEVRKYGELKAVFQLMQTPFQWKVEVPISFVRDRTLAFMIPTFPYAFSSITAVDVILCQNDRQVDSLKYFYHATDTQCSKCRYTMLANASNVLPNVSQKRRLNLPDADGDVFDSVVPIQTNAPGLRPTVSEEGTRPSPISSNSSSLPTLTSSTASNESSSLIDLLRKAIESLFVHNDSSTLLRLSRGFIKKQPQLLHEALDNGHLEWVNQYFVTASVQVLQHRNELEETILLHTIRLNQINVLQSLMKNKHFDNLVDDIDPKKNNLFHLLAMNVDSSNLLDLLINYFHEKEISIGEHFDQINEDLRTPLQLAVCQNNLPATQRLLKDFRHDICEIQNHTGDNLIHLAIRHGDLTMVKYLIDEGNLIQQGNESNTKMTPLELARALKHSDMVEYLEHKYPPVQIQEDESSDDDYDQ